MSLRGVPQWRDDEAIPKDCFASLAMTVYTKENNLCLTCGYLAVFIIKNITKIMVGGKPH
jgi:hypothetical protein